MKEVTPKIQAYRTLQDTVYWLGINEQLEKLVLNCKLCLKYSKVKSKQAQNMSLGQEVPTYPWMKAATDIFHFENDSYLLKVDYMSRFPVVHKLMSTTTQQVASQMKLIFSEYGWPETIVSNNGPSYSAETVIKLMTDYSVNHITSSPHYLQSNGLAEKYVQIVKNLFYKAQEEGIDLYKFDDQISCSHLCRSCNHKLLEPNSQCPMGQEHNRD